jgi:hypothetical protein
VSDGRSGRRPLLLGLIGGTAALGAVTAAGRINAHLDDGDPGEPRGALQLTAESPSMYAATLDLGDELSLAGGAWSTTKLATSTHSMVAATWTGPGTPSVRIRSRTDGRWTAWQRLATMHDGPDDDGPEASPIRGTELVWTGDSDGIQVRVTGDLPAALALTLLRPARLPGDTAAIAAAPVGRRSSARAGTTDLKPVLLSRASWGADESLRGKPSYNSTIQQAHVHHSASGNDYTEADVAGIIRGFYRYHTVSLGWSDLGYNFLVDRFGRTWIGRAGGPNRPVRGAHTLGFNATSVGICVIGNFDTAIPTPAVLQSVAAVAAWKLQKYGGNPVGTVQVASEGSDKFKAGRAVLLPTVDGHRDTNDTACPGQHLYDVLQSVRDRAAALVTAATAAPPVQVVAPSTLAGDPVVGQTLSVTPGAFGPAGTASTVAWLRNGTPTGATGSTYLLTAADHGTTVGAQVTTAIAGYTAAVETLPGSAVRAVAAVKARAKTRRGVTTVEVTVKGRGVGSPGSGPVTVGIRKRRKTVTLQNGAGAVRFRNLKSGMAPLSVSFPGDMLVAPGSAQRNLQIARRP